MSRYRFLGLTALVLALSVLAAQTGRSAEPAHGEQRCVIYSLAELGDDPDLGKWIADTIPEVIEPGSWSRQGDSSPNQALRYYAPKKILVVYHTAAVQTKVDAFLKDMKKSVAADAQRNAVAARTSEQPRSVTAAEYREPASIRAASTAPDPSLSYPVPAPARPPKHLFHFIIRYEGDGVVDENVVKVVKAQMGVKDDKEMDRPTSAASAPRRPGEWGVGSREETDRPTSTASAPSRASFTPPPPPTLDNAVQPMRNAEDRDGESLPPTDLPPQAAKKGPSD